MANRGKDLDTELERLEEEAKRLMSEGKWRQAMEVFSRGLDLAPKEVHISFVNNYALCLERLGELERALETLTPCLDPAAVPSPFAHGLAARLLLKLGRRPEAEAQFQEAMADFERGLKIVGRAIPKEWWEYLITLQSVAGDLGRHRLVLEMHKQWQSRYTSNHNHFLAGVASFNLGRYQQAISCWRPCFRDDWANTMAAYARVAAEVERGLLPPFQMAYNPPDQEELAAKVKEFYEPAEMVLALAALAEEGYKNSRFVKEIVLRTGDWGEKLARNLARDAVTPKETKMEALAALVESGRHPAEEPFQLLIGGRIHDVVYQRFEVVDDDQEAAAAVDEAITLRDAGKGAQAEEILRGVLKRVIYPPAALTLANLLRQRGELDEAGMYLEIVARVAPDNPRVLFNLCGYHLQREEYEKAREIFARIDPRGEDEEFREHYGRLKESFRRSEFVMSLPDPDEIAGEFLKEEDDKPIGVKLNLLQGLRRLPADWLVAACAAHGLPPAKRKEERIARLAEHIAANPRQVKIRLAPAARECLAFLLAEGGWAKMSVLERRFGSAKEDGYWWSERPPESALGLLRLYGLAYVGRYAIEGRRHKVAVVPADLREALG